MDAVTGVRRSLWRAAVVFRVIAAIFCCWLIFRWRHLYAEKTVAVLVAIAIVLVTVAVAVLGLAGRAHRAWFVVADLAITIVLTLLSHQAQTPAQFHGGMPTLTTVWAAGPVIEAGLLGGWLGGLLGALGQLAATIAVREGYDGDTLKNGLLLLITGVISGIVLSWTSRAEVERAELATLAERDRLARQIHDGVLQVLALVHRKAAAAGGDWAELGQAAAEQEAALRGLITARAHPVQPDGQQDLVPELVKLGSARVTVSVPAHPLLLDAARAGELTAAVRAALHNVERHAGPSAQAWVLAEQLDGQLWVTVRDDGCGVSPAQLAEAAARGRLGVATSIRGRVAELGGTVRITSQPGAGTEVEVVVPVSTAKNRAP